MSYYLKKLQKIIGKPRKVGWHYRHAKDFNHALDIFVDFIVDQLHELADFRIEVAAGVRDISPELKDRLSVSISHFILEAKHTLANIVEEFATLLDAYDIVTPIDEDSYLALQRVLKKREQDVLKELTAIHGKVIDLEAQAFHLGYKKQIPVFKTLKKFGLADLEAMFKSHSVPEVFSLLNESDGDDWA